jgi:hypothetical protein
VFCQADGTPYTANAFTKMHNARLKAWFGNPAVTNNSLRHAMATQVMADPTLALGERRRIAADMGHGVEANMTYAVVPPRGGRLSRGRAGGELRIQTVRDGRVREYVCHQAFPPAYQK